MEGHPLRISMPRAEVTKSSLLNFRHTAYVVEIDDCGKTYMRHRRFKNFVWLHIELRRRELACALPELPPKKGFGNLDSSFVERRRIMLEEYLRALLALPAVILDDTLWAFLDADTATAVVPRFLCAVGAPSLAELERVSASELNIFRLCSPAVLQALARFAHDESSCELPQEPRARDRAASARLAGLRSLCAVLGNLLAHSHVRQALVEAGMFGALLALLWRATEDREAVAAGEGGEQAEVYEQACAAVADCLRRLVEGSRGVALLHFCQRGDGVAALKRLASAGATSLHYVAAQLIWKGLQCIGVVDALAGASARGLAVLGRLLSSPDLRARTLAALCVGWVLRHDTALDAEQYGHCMQALRPLPLDLDSAQAATLLRAAAAVLEPCHARRRSSGNWVKTVAAGEGAAGDRPTWHLHRDDGLVKVLRSLCFGHELERLRVLLGKASGEFSGGADAVTAAAVAILDHCALHAAGDPVWLAELGLVAPQLQHLAKEEDDEFASFGKKASIRPGLRCASLGSFDLTLPPSALPDDTRVRAARVLVRLAGSGVDIEAPGVRPSVGEALPLEALERRTKVLQVVSRHLDACQAKATARLEVAGSRCKDLAGHIESGSLVGELSLAEARLDAFSGHVSALRQSRVVLSGAIADAAGGLAGAAARLEERRARRELLALGVEGLFGHIAARDAEERVKREAEEFAAAWEEAEGATAAEAEELLASLGLAAGRARSWTEAAAEAEAEACALAKREAELHDLHQSAPAQIVELEARMMESEYRRAELSDREVALEDEGRVGEEQATALQEQEEEAATALRNLAALKVELDAFRGTLNSELILTDDETVRLRQLASQMQPTRPARLSAHLAARLKSLVSSEEDEDDYATPLGAPGSPGASPSARGGDCSLSLLGKKSSHGSVASLGQPLGSKSSGSNVSSAYLGRQAGNVSCERSDGVAHGDSAASGATAGQALLVEDEAVPPAWDDVTAEKAFAATPHFRSLSSLYSARQRFWSSESSWLAAMGKRIMFDRDRLGEERRRQIQEVQAAFVLEDQLREQLAFLDDPGGHALRHESAALAAEAGAEAAAAAATEASAAEIVRREAEAMLESGSDALLRAQAACAHARAAAAAEEASCAQARREAGVRTNGLELGTVHFFHAWKEVELNERRLAHLQARVSGSLEVEAARRGDLREEIKRLLAELQKLDAQLDVKGERAGGDSEEEAAFVARG